MRYFIIFHANGTLYRCKCLTTGLKPAQGKLSVALKPIFAHIPSAQLIHNDLIIATETHTEHKEGVLQVMQAISSSGLTLNPEKCSFGEKQIQFWGMLIDKDGIRPDPTKPEALDHMAPPANKEELISFLCMMQPNSEFIANFSKKSAVLHELSKSKIKFKWEKEHKERLLALLKELRQDVLLRYFDMTKPTFIFVDAHNTELGAMLAQGDDITSAKPVAFASRATSQAESRYSQLDLEAVSIDFGLQRFRDFSETETVGSPNKITIVTDHKSLCSVFSGN